MGDLYAAPISDVHFLGNIYQTLLNDHGLTEDAVKGFFYEFVRAFMIHHIDVTSYDASTDEFKNIQYAVPSVPPGLPAAVKAKYLSYIQYPTRYFSDPTAKKTRETKLGAIYQEKLYDLLEPADTKYYALDSILDGTLLAKAGEPHFLFPQGTRDTLRNVLGGASLQNSDHLELFVKIDKDKVAGTSINKRILLCLCDRRINSIDFKNKYPTYPALPFTYSGFMPVLLNSPVYQNIDNLVRRNVYKPIVVAGPPTVYGPLQHTPQAVKDEAKRISGRIISGAFSIFSEPTGEIAHLDIMRFFGQQHSFDEGRLQLGDPAYFKPITDGDSTYWRNLHLSTKSGAKATHAALSYGDRTTIDYYNNDALYGNVYPVKATNHLKNKKAYLSELLTAKQGSIDANVEAKFAALEPILKSLNARKNFFVLKTKYFETPLQFVKDTGYDGYFRSYINLAGNVFGSDDQVRKLLKSSQTTLLKNMQLLDAKLNDPSQETPSLPELQLQDILFYRNFKKKVKDAVGEFPKAHLKNDKIKLSQCEAFPRGIDLTKENILEIFDTCENALRSQMIFQLNRSFRSYILDDLASLSKEKIKQSIQSGKFKTLTSYASVQTISQTLFEFIEIDKRKEDGHYPPDFYAIFSLELLRNIDLQYYTIVNPGEAFRTDSGLQWVPPKQRRICFLLDFLHVMNMKMSEISSEIDTQKKSFFTTPSEIIKEKMGEEFGEKNNVNLILGKYTLYLFNKNKQGSIATDYAGKPKPEKDAVLATYVAQETSILQSQVTVKGGVKIKFSAVLPRVEQIHQSAQTQMDNENAEIALYNQEIEKRKEKAVEYHRSILKAILGNNKFIFSLLFPINHLTYSQSQFNHMQSLLALFFDKAYTLYISGGLINSLKGSFNKWLDNHDVRKEPGKSILAILRAIIEDINRRLQQKGRPALSFGTRVGLGSNVSSFEGNANTRRNRRIRINSTTSNNEVFRKIERRTPTPTSSLTNDPGSLSSGGGRTRSRGRQLKRTRKNRKV